MAACLPVLHPILVLYPGLRRNRQRGKEPIAVFIRTRKGVQHEFTRRHRDIRFMVWAGGLLSLAMARIRSSRMPVKSKFTTRETSRFE